MPYMPIRCYLEYGKPDPKHPEDRRKSVQDWIVLDAIGYANCSGPRFVVCRVVDGRGHYTNGELVCKFDFYLHKEPVYDPPNCAPVLDIAADGIPLIECPF